MTVNNICVTLDMEEAHREPHVFIIQNKLSWSSFPQIRLFGDGDCENPAPMGQAQAWGTEQCAGPISHSCNTKLAYTCPVFSPPYTCLAASLTCSTTDLHYP